MAKQSKTLPARKPQPGDDSLLLRSAEALGRMIGTLQRELDVASRELRGGRFGAEQPTSTNGTHHKPLRARAAKEKSAKAVTRHKAAPLKKPGKGSARKSTRAR